MYRTENSLECRTLAFLGAGCERYARFAAALIASSKPQSNILVWDASFSKSLYIGTVGDVSKKREMVYFRSVVYTADAKYARAHVAEYDVILVADDFATERGNFVEYGDILDYVYLCMSANRYALAVMLRVASCIVGKQLPINYIFCGTPEDAERWRVKEYWKYLQGKEEKKREIFYVPLCENDTRGILDLEYGVLRMRNLSDGLRSLLFELSGHFSVDSNVIRSIEQSTVFNI